MKTTKIEIKGQEYLLCFSARVVRNCSERYNGIQNMEKALATGDEYKTLDECFFILSEMVKAGSAYAKIEGLENPAPLSYDDLYDICDMSILSEMQKKIFETINAGSEREVEVEQEKNGMTT